MKPAKFLQNTLVSKKNEIHQNFTKAAKISFAKSGKDFATHESFKGTKDCPGNGQDLTLVLAKKLPQK